MSITLDVDSFVFDPRPNYPLVVAAKRYRPSNAVDSPDALTLIFAHGTGYHKEQWEPTVLDLLNMARNDLLIREIWSVDCPNHGDSAIVNENTLLWGYEKTFGWSEYSYALYLFVSGFGKGLPSTDYFRGSNLVAIGHSMGAIAVLLTLTFPNAPRWKALVLVEAMILPKWAQTGPSDLADLTLTRRDMWPSKEEAYKVMSEREAFKPWDRRVLRIYCENGLRDLPTAYYPDKMEGVTLKCSKIQEASCFRDVLGRARAYSFLADACTLLPIHAIYGGVNDYTQKKVKTDIITNSAKGRLASVQFIEGAGHLVVQTHPKELAVALRKILTQSCDHHADHLASSKL